MLETALEELAPRPGERIADVGFGGGLTLERIRERSAPARPVGMEISLAMVEAARRRWGNAMELFQADVASIPLADSSLDALLTVNTIYFWKEPERALGEIRRVLKPGGRLVLGIRRPWTMRIAPMTWFGFRLYSVGEATAMLEKTGFSVTVTEKVKGEVFLTGRA